MGVVELRTPPYRIETERLVLRCYEPTDAKLLKEAVDSSIEHLRPWMPWARFEPQTLEEKVALIDDFRRQFQEDEQYVYGIFSRDESRLLGGTGLHRRSGPLSLEIGYWIRSDSLRRGIATEVTAVLARVAFEQCHAVRVDIQVDPDNARSAGIPRKLGFTHEGTLAARLEPKNGDGPRRDAMLFTVLREDFTSSPCLAYQYTC
jgi:RimJ/RimL family protein N-acetyltransferase